MEEPRNSSKYEPLASWHIIPLEKFRHARILTHWLCECLKKQGQHLTDEYIDKIEFFFVKFFKFSKRWVYLNSSASCSVVLELFFNTNNILFRISSKTNMKKLLLLDSFNEFVVLRQRISTIVCILFVIIVRYELGIRTFDSITKL